MTSFLKPEETVVPSRTLPKAQFRTVLLSPRNLYSDRPNTYHLSLLPLGPHLLRYKSLLM